MGALVILYLFLSTCNAIDVILKIDHRVVRTIDTTKFLSFTFDTSFVRGNFCSINWLKAILLARSLTPCYVRVGGDDSDFMIFEESVHVHRSDAPPEAPKPTPYTNGCGMFDRGFFKMTRNQLDCINWFVQASGLKLMFDLSAVYGRHNGTAWNANNAIKLLNYAQEMGYAMDFELGNEPENYPDWYKFTISGKEMASNYQLLRSVLNSYPLYRGSKLFGPAAGTPFSRQYKEFIKTGGLDYINAVTFHQYGAHLCCCSAVSETNGECFSYYGPGAGQNLSFFFDPFVLDSLAPVLQRAVSLVKRTRGNKRKQVWLGETASSYNGGTAGISNSYAAGFMWMDKLGLCALNGIDAVFRHTFFMGNYAMTNNNTNPNPDYWLSLLYRTLIGKQVLNVKSNLGGEGAGPKQVRFYAHKNRTHTVLFGMNLQNKAVRIRISGHNKPVTQYLLEPKEGKLTSTRVLLNGCKLIFDGKRSPSVTNMGVLVTPPIEVPSKRYGMWVWRN